MAAAQKEAVRARAALLRKALATIDVDLDLPTGARYRSRACRRRAPRFSDVDILVPFSRLAEAEAALMLRTAGRRPIITLTTSGTTGSGCTNCRHFSTMLPADGARCTTRSSCTARLCRIPRNCSPPRSRSGGDRLRVLCPADMVLHSATHIFHNDDLSLRAARPYRSRQSAPIERNASSDELRAGRCRARLARPLFYGLRYATRFLGTPVPPEVHRRA
jgi:hypothetical protein